MQVYSYVWLSNLIQQFRIAVARVRWLDSIGVSMGVSDASYLGVFYRYDARLFHSNYTQIGQR